MRVMEFLPWLVWLTLACVVVFQAIRGVALDGALRPLFRRSENPKSFWAVIAIQTIWLFALALVWVWINASKSPHD